LGTWNRQKKLSFPLIDSAQKYYKQKGQRQIKIQILGSGCAKCKKLAETMENAAKELEVIYEIEKVTDIMKIMDLGVIFSPGLAIDGKVVPAGKIPSMDEAKHLLAPKI